MQYTVSRDKKGRFVQTTVKFWDRDKVGLLLASSIGFTLGMILGISAQGFIWLF